VKFAHTQRMGSRRGIYANVQRRVCEAPDEPEPRSAKRGGSVAPAGIAKPGSRSQPHRGPQTVSDTGGFERCDAFGRRAAGQPHPVRKWRPHRPDRSDLIQADTPPVREMLDGLDRTLEHALARPEPLDACRFDEEPPERPGASRQRQPAACCEA